MSLSWAGLFAVFAARAAMASAAGRCENSTTKAHGGTRGLAAAGGFLFEAVVGVQPDRKAMHGTPPSPRVRGCRVTAGGTIAAATVALGAPLLSFPGEPTAVASEGLRNTFATLSWQQQLDSSPGMNDHSVNYVLLSLIHI